MSDFEARLTAALHSDDPPGRDARFRVEVLVRLERARFRRQVARTVAGAIALAVLAVVAAPLWANTDEQLLWFGTLGAAALCVLPFALVQPRLITLARTVGRLLYP